MLTRTRMSTITGLAALLPAMAIGGTAPSTADPTAGSGQSADTVINELSDEGYTVAINWVGGTSTLSLSECRVNSIHNPNRGIPATPKTSVTVYVDVQCPDESSNS